MGAPVNPNLITWLKASELFESVEDGAIAAIWGDAAQEVSQSSYLRVAADAATEAARQQALTGIAQANDAVRLKGAFAGLEGRTITVTGDRLGYQAGLTMLVVASDVDLERGVTRLEGFIGL